LARHPRQITVGDVIQSVSGPFLQVSSLDAGLSSDNGARPDNGHFKAIWIQVDQAIASVLNQITFEDMARRARANPRQMMYHI
jgi:DNA-binding IscR family transcriptional regulator